ncbi:MAG: mazG [Chlamydiales bacterium]|nr:mazG [Chlamydiales bacterium]
MDPKTPSQSDYQPGQLPFFKSLVEVYALENIWQAAFTIQKLSSVAHLDFPDLPAVIHKVQEEHEELCQALQEYPKNRSAIQEEIGDCFFTLINLCRHLLIQPESVIDQAVKKYLIRLSLMEEALQKEGKTFDMASFQQLEELWQQAKQAYRQNPEELLERLRLEGLQMLSKKQPLEKPEGFTKKPL